MGSIWGRDWTRGIPGFCHCGGSDRCGGWDDNVEWKGHWPQLQKREMIVCIDEREGWRTLVEWEFVPRFLVQSMHRSATLRVPFLGGRVCMPWWGKCSLGDFKRVNARRWEQRDISTGLKIVWPAFGFLARSMLQTPRREHIYAQDPAESKKRRPVQHLDIRREHTRTFIPSARDIWRSREGKVGQFAHGQPSRTGSKISIAAFKKEEDYSDLPIASLSLRPPNAIGPVPSSHGPWTPIDPWTSSSAWEAS